jgi:uncharacterized membrane protein YbjE (DUF340 family)
MWSIVLFLSIGIAIGFLFNLNEKAKKINSNLQLLGLVLLLFSMGISIGANEKIVNSIGKIGLQSFLFAFFSIASTVAVGFIISKFVYRRN